MLIYLVNRNLNNSRPGSSSSLSSSNSKFRFRYFTPLSFSYLSQAKIVKRFSPGSNSTKEIAKEVTQKVSQTGSRFPVKPLSTSNVVNKSVNINNPDSSETKVRTPTPNLHAKTPKFREENQNLANFKATAAAKVTEVPKQPMLELNKVLESTYNLKPKKLPSNASSVPGPSKWGRKTTPVDSKKFDEQKREYTTMVQYNKFKADTGTSVTKVSDKRNPANNHFCFKGMVDSVCKILTHWKGTETGKGVELPVICDGDLYRQESFTENNTYLQRIATQPNYFRVKNVSWYDLERMDIEKLYKMETLMRISEQFPKEFMWFQGIIKWISADKKATFKEKNEFMVDGFIKEMSDKITRPTRP